MPNPVAVRRVLGSAPFDELTTPNLILALLLNRMPSVADSTAISSWTDFSASANHAVQAVGSLQPLYKTGIQNGLPGLLWDGSNDAMATAAMSVTTFTIFTVMRLTGSAGMIYEQSVNAVAPGLWLYGTTAASMRVSKVAGFSDYDISSNWAVDNATKIVTHHYDGTHAGHTLNINGAAQSLTSVTDTGANSVAVSDALYIGARAGTGLYCNGYFFALMVCSPHISAGQISKVQRGLMRRWGVT